MAAFIRGRGGCIYTCARACGDNTAHFTSVLPLIQKLRASMSVWAACGQKQAEASQLACVCDAT